MCSIISSYFKLLVLRKEQLQKNKRLKILMNSNIVWLNSSNWKANLFSNELYLQSEKTTRPLLNLAAMSYSPVLSQKKEKGNRTYRTCLYHFSDWLVIIMFCFFKIYTTCSDVDAKNTMTIILFNVQ